MREMTPRERVLTALAHEEPDQVPKTAGFTPHLYQVFREKTGATDPYEYFKIEIRGVGFKGPKEIPDFSVYFDEPLPPNASVNEYGMANVPGGFYHFTRRMYPIKSFTSIEQLERYPWPNFMPSYRHEHLEESVRRLHEREFFVYGGVGHIFEIAWQMRSMERLFMDFIENQEFAEMLLDRITEDRAFMAQRYAEAGVDMLLIGDDVGMQDRLMMSPQMWRRWLKPRLARVIQAGKEVNPKVHIYYHSDGNIEDIIPDLIEVGVDVLNPVQPECMDPAKLKRLYGDRLSFWGTIGTQTTMPFGTPEEVKRVVHERVRTVGKGGGLVLAPTHVLEPDVPWENVIAFFEAVEETRRYR
jgi:uroporphyrinogen decarboxylase